MRVLMTTDTVGGVWTYTNELTVELLKRGVAVALAVIGRPPSAAQTQSLAQHREADFRWMVIEAPLEWMNGNEQAYAAAEPLLLQMAREFRPDLLHSNQFCFGALPLTVPRLVVAHSDVLSWAAACRNAVIVPCPWLDNYCTLTTAGLRGADSVVAPTRWMLTALRQNYPLPACTRVIPNGRTLVAAGPPLARKLQAVSAGRLWDEAKNLQLLLQVQAPFPILVAGEMEYESCSAPMAPSVRLLGQLAEEHLLALFRESAIYVCTSRYEPFGLAPLEAALCGCAVLANDLPALREVWGESALYFRGAPALSALLGQLSRDPEKLAAAQRRSWQHAQKYTAARMADEYLALYHAMLTTQQEPACVA